MRGKQPIRKGFPSLLMLAFLFAPSASPLFPQSKPESLYRRIGGYDAIAAVVDDLVVRMGSDPQLARFSAGFSRDSKRRRRQFLVEQLCEAAGGPCYYIGRSMKMTHEGLAITDAEWDAVIKHLTASLDARRVGAREKAEMLAFFSAAKADIVGSAPGGK